MKYLAIVLFMFLTTIFSFSDEVLFQCKTQFNRGDVVTVLSKNNIDSYTLELVNAQNQSLSSNIFFPVDTFLFKGYASLVGLDSTLKAGQYYLLVKNGEDKLTDKLTITVNRNIFKKERIALNDTNSSLRTNTDPEIIREAEQIHSIYETSNFSIVSGLYSLQLPLENGIITSWYGDRRNFQYSDGTLSPSIHTGTDFAAAFGTKITAASKGRVVFAGKRIITGNSVVVEYLPGVYGIFFHMNELFVSKGDRVRADTVIGSLGSSGLATGPHLHWELRVGSVAVNPWSLMSNGLIDKSLIMGIVRSHTSE